MWIEEGEGLKSVIVFMIGLLVCDWAWSEQCRRYTPEQQQIIQQAHSFGLPYDYGFTLAAIVIKESFVGNRIIRYNPTDPSTGVTHIQFDTLKHLSGLNHWDTLALAEELIVNDLLAFEYAVKKLDSVRGNFWQKWRRYNGKGKAAEQYANDVQGIIRGLKRCGVVESWE